jgi:hypothetical protein
VSLNEPDEWETSEFPFPHVIHHAEIFTQAHTKKELLFKDKNVLKPWKGLCICAHFETHEQGTLKLGNPPTISRILVRTNAASGIQHALRDHVPESGRQALRHVYVDGCMVKDISR